MAALIRYNNVKLRKTLQNRHILRQICQLGRGWGVRGVFHIKNKVIFQQYITAYSRLLLTYVHTRSCKNSEIPKCIFGRNSKIFFGSRNKKSVLPCLMKGPVVFLVRMFLNENIPKIQQGTRKFILIECKVFKIKILEL